MTPDGIKFFFLFIAMISPLLHIRPVMRSDSGCHHAWLMHLLILLRLIHDGGRHIITPASDNLYCGPTRQPHTLTCY